MKAIEYLRDVSATLTNHGIKDAGRESEILFTECTGINRTSLYRDNPELSALQMNEIKDLLERRKKREPLQYITGQVDFCGIKIKVGSGVLVPRPETELVVEEVIKTYSLQSTVNSQLKILDLCTGSGCIALAIAKQYPESTVYGTDISKQALRYAEENARITNIRNVTFLQGDLLDPVRGMRFDIIVSNPPYIRRQDITDLQPEIKEWEPSEALDGGEDGLFFYKKILKEATAFLNDNGSVILEVGDKEADEIVRIARNSDLKIVAIIKDYNGIDRALRLKPFAV